MMRLFWLLFFAFKLFKKESLMKKINSILLLLSASTFALPTFAADSATATTAPNQKSPLDMTLNAKVSTLGGGLEVAFPMTHSIDGRLGINKFRYTMTKTSTSNGTSQDYKGDLNLESFEALADWHPFAGSFRMSAGAIYNNNNLKLSAVSGGGLVNIGGVNYPVAAGQSVDATIDFNKVAPYLGIGWGRTPKNTGFSFTSDIGVLFQGSPKGSVTTNITGVSPADLAKANADLNSSLSSFKAYPVISIGMGYTF
jgi:hypothetical protein